MLYPPIFKNKFLYSTALCPNPLTEFEVSEMRGVFIWYKDSSATRQEEGAHDL